jgi:hypothetical protein
MGAFFLATSSQKICLPYVALEITFRNKVPSGNICA